MAANSVRSDDSDVDMYGEVLQPYFGGYPGKAGDRWISSEVIQTTGSEPAICRTFIPCTMNATDEGSNTVALDPEGPMKDLKHGTEQRTFRKFFGVDDNGAQVAHNELLFTGKIVVMNFQREVVGDSAVDGIEVWSMDGRVDLRKIRVVGRYICTAGGGNIYYQQGWPAHFNPGGRPNKINDTSGRPWFAPSPDYGLEQDEEPPDPTTPSYSKATYWLLGDILAYLRNTLGPDSPQPSSLSSQLVNWPWLPKVPSYIVWPQGFGSQIDTEAVGNFNNGTGQNNTSTGGARKGRDLNLNGVFLSGVPGEPGAFDMIFEAAGGWTWTLDYIAGEDGIKNVLKAIPSRWISSSNGVEIPYAAGGHAATTLKKGVVTRVNFQESSEHTATRAIASTGLVKVETRCSMKASDHGGTAAIRKAWTQEREDAMWDYAVTLGRTKEAVRKAYQKYPEVGVCYELNPSFNFQTGTDHSAYPRAAITRPVWPFLLSFQGSSTGPIDSNMRPYPTQVEVYSNSGAVWTVSIENTGFQPMDNGIIELPILRELFLEAAFASSFTDFPLGAFQLSGITTLASGSWTKSNIVVSDIRMTLAIRCDHRYMMLAKSTIDLGSSVSGDLIIDDAPDNDRLAEGYSKPLYLDLQNLYELWFRYNSYPEPQSSGGTMFANKSTVANALRSDDALLLSHLRRALKERYRLKRSGYIACDGCFQTSWPIGAQVAKLIPIGGAASLKPFDLRAVITGRRFAHEQQIVEDVPSVRNVSEMMLG